MRTLTTRRALEAWERGQRADPQGRALALLAAVLPDVAPERLTHLPLGQRDALLIRLRECTFGSQAKIFVQCPRCDARLEYPLDLRAYDAAGALARRPAPGPLSALGFEIRFRLPSGEDLVAMSRCPDVETARALLVSRCVLAAERAGRPVPPEELPEAVLELLGREMEELDPLAYLPLAIDCPRCAHQWLALLEAGAFLWQEISVSAERLLRDVHALALAYGWSETEILGMSDARRKFYLSQIPPSAAASPAAPGKARQRP
ncbi:MAG TPA: phage baseplate protein [Thermoanaerobaculia bacterium]|jgi:hypothetical protein